MELVSSNRLRTKRHGTLELEVHFEQLADRWQQSISLVVENNLLPLLQSVEGTTAERWPLHPPLQSLHFETQAGEKQVALLVGQAGRSHWSASIATGEAGCLEFDHACRIAEAPTFLGASFSLAAGWQVAQTPAGYELHCDAHRILIELLHGTIVQILPGEIRFTAASGWSGKMETLRWGWRLRC